jgi:putative salt-induced outer membrane protein YdiY
MFHARIVLLSCALCAAVPLAARADEIVFNNGDHLSGDITALAGGKLTVKTEVAGEIKVDLKEVKTFSTTHPIEIHLQDGTVLHQSVNTADAGRITTAGSPQIKPQTLSLSAIDSINPPAAHWTGSITASGLLARGNTNSDAFSLSADAVRRGDNDRITLGAGYYFAKSKDPATGDSATTADNWFLLGKYDYFFTKKFYGYALTRVERDRIADLDLRLSPGVGVGYQWFDRDDFHLSTEAGLGWVYESYANDGTDNHPSARLAYHVDKQLNDAVKLFHDLEYLPSLDSLSDFNLNADAGLRAALTKTMYSELKIEWRYDATPAPGAHKNDVRYMLGVGWQF